VGRAQEAAGHELLRDFFLGLFRGEPTDSQAADQRKPHFPISPDAEVCGQLRDPMHSAGESEELSDLPVQTVAWVINHFFRAWGHQFIYDFETLAALLKNAGFDQIVQCNVGVSSRIDLCSLEAHGLIIGHDFNQLESLVVEATRCG
jgi:hypothetical protein